MLPCGDDLGNGQGTVKCEDITDVVCDRVSMTGDYTEYSCKYKVGTTLYDPNIKKLRIYNVGSESGTDTLTTVGAVINYDSNRSED
jgi:hypothetical protein